MGPKDNYLTQGPSQSQLDKVLSHLLYSEIYNLIRLKGNQACGGKNSLYLLAKP